MDCGVSLFGAGRKRTDCIDWLRQRPQLRLLGKRGAAESHNVRLTRKEPNGSSVAPYMTKEPDRDTRTNMSGSARG